MIRVTSGSAKGRKLLVSNVKNIRLPQDTFKLALFSILAEKVEDAHCLDLFAGSGSFGIEALSRGASFCDFVDENRAATEAIKQNVIKCGFSDSSEVTQASAVKFLAETDTLYDLVFMDPFYDDLKQRYLFQNLENSLNEDALIVYSHGEEADVKEMLDKTSFEIVTERNYGNAFLTILRKK